jgi:pimeloyl-[acyl-carrier protein] methyl ester esterase
MKIQNHFFLIRGLIREERHWGQFPDLLLNYFPGSRVTTLDLPGAGKHFQQISPLTISSMVKSMRSEYLREIDKVGEKDSSNHLIAISLGGMVGVEWMRLFPQDFQQATFINTSFGGLSPFYHRLLPSALLYLLKVPVLKGRNKEGHILRLVSNNTQVFLPTLDLWERIQKERPVSLMNTIRQLLAAASFKVADFRPAIPIQILGASMDRMVSVECSIKISKAWNLPLELHPTGGHDLTVDDPEWVALKIKESHSKE